MARIKKLLTASLVLAFTPLILVEACGTASQPGTGAPAQPSASSFQALDAQVQSNVASYRTTMMDGATTMATCRDVHDRYDASVRPSVTRMVGMGPGMDSYIDDHGGAGDADVACASASMLDELDYHRSLACSFSDLASNQAEASRHADAMNAFADQMWSRCSEIMGGDGGAATWSAMMASCQTWDGRCTTMMHHCCSTTNSGMGMGMMHDGCNESD